MKTDWELCGGGWGREPVVLRRRGRDFQTKQEQVQRSWGVKILVRWSTQKETRVIGEEAECREQGKEQVWRVRPEFNSDKEFEFDLEYYTKPWKILSEKDEGIPNGMNWQLDSNSMLWEEQWEWKTEES